MSNSVHSKDGTIIGYHQLGQGPGLVVLHGTMESAKSHLQLAEALADRYTVYLPDRRGRGMSGAYSAHYTIQEEVEDLDAVLAATGAHVVFGVSSGAIITLCASLLLPAIHRIILFEPPLPVDDRMQPAVLARYDQEIRQGKVAAALVTAMKAAQMGPKILRLMPRWLLRFLTHIMMVAEDKRARPEDVTMRMLAPTVHYDFSLVLEMKGRMDDFRKVPVDVLLLGGNKSPAYLKAALDVLEHVLPRARRVELSGVGHGASGNVNRGGRPGMVAEEIFNDH